MEKKELQEWKDRRNMPPIVKLDDYNCPKCGKRT
jgi:hypothetical protein